MLLTCDHLLSWHKGSEKIEYKTTRGVLGNRLNDSIYVDPDTGKDDNTGADYSPYRTIKKALKEVKTDEKIRLKNGIYTGNGNNTLIIDKNVTIIGESQKYTVIDGEKIFSIFEIGYDAHLTIQNLTMKNGMGDNGGAIYNKGTLTVEECTFEANKSNEGGAIYNNKGKCTVKKSNFRDNNSKTAHAIYCNSDVYVEAISNWWGSAAGPTEKDIYGHVKYTPWLTKPI